MNYIILSPKEGNGKQPVFWRKDSSGYTYYPFAAGVYTKEQIESNPNYYNNGFSSLAVPLTEEALEEIGFKCMYDDKKTNGFLQSSKQKAKGINISKQPNQEVQS